MARISGVDLPRDKRIEISLTYIFGVGRPTSRKILSAVGINPDTRTRNLTEDDFQKLREEVAKLTTEGDLRRQVLGNIKRLQDIGCYRGLRHRRHLPAHGQRTRTNSRTVKGPRKTVPGRGRRRGATKK
ncbi:MAG: 30S ribosomal protein S13 [Anaerolineaceae bacterium]|nr:30S ribosomal protein S13 [Anaerolineaceae bacterium]